MIALGCAAFGVFLSIQYILDQQSLTSHDYNNVRDGMTLPEIEAVLGSPTSINPKVGGGKEVRWFGRNEGLIYVEFNSSGAIVRKNFTEDARNYNLSFFPRIRD